MITQEQAVNLLIKYEAALSKIQNIIVNNTGVGARMDFQIFPDLIQALKTIAGGSKDSAPQKAITMHLHEIDKVIERHLNPALKQKQPTIDIPSLKTEIQHFLEEINPPLRIDDSLITGVKVEMGRYTIEGRNNKNEFRSITIDTKFGIVTDHEGKTLDMAKGYYVCRMMFKEQDKIYEHFKITPPEKPKVKSSDKFIVSGEEYMQQKIDLPSQLSTQPPISTQKKFKEDLNAQKNKDVGSDTKVQLMDDFMRAFKESLQKSKVLGITPPSQLMDKINKANKAFTLEDVLDHINSREGKSCRSKEVLENIIGKDDLAKLLKNPKEEINYSKKDDNESSLGYRQNPGQ